jgi:hypothetical protein
MPINSKLQEGDILQFPSQSLKKIAKINDDTILFVSLRNAKKQAIYTKSFVLAFCDLLPPKVDLTYYLNTTHDRRSAIDVKAVTVDAYSDANTLKGYKIDDEEMLDMPKINEEEE